MFGSLIQTPMTPLGSPTEPKTHLHSHTAKNTPALSHSQKHIRDPTQQKTHLHSHTAKTHPQSHTAKKHPHTHTAKKHQHTHTAKNTATDGTPCILRDILMQFFPIIRVGAERSEAPASRKTKLFGDFIVLSKRLLLQNFQN